MTPTFSPEHVIARVRVWDAATVDGLAKLIGGKVTILIPPLRSVTYRVDPDARDAALATLQTHPSVERAGLVGQGRPLFYQEPPVGVTPPSHVRLGAWPYAQRHLRMMNVLRAWRHTHGASDSPVAVLDMGIKNLATASWAAGKTILAWNPYRNNSDTTATGWDWHGTAATSIIAANGASGSIFGGAPLADLIVENIQDAGTGAASTAAAIVYAVDHGAKVLSLSIGFAVSDDPTLVISDAIDYAYNNGAITVWAAGNDPAQTAENNYPQQQNPRVLSVAGIQGISEEVAGFEFLSMFMSKGLTSYGSWVDGIGPFFATAMCPAANASVNTAGAVMGTSFSCPAFAGVIQLVVAMNPSLTGVQAAEIVKATARRARPVEDWMFYGYFPESVGIPDAEAAVLRAQSLLPGNTSMIPYMRILPMSPAPFGGDYSGVDLWHADVQEDFLGGEVRNRVGGFVGFQLEGFCSTGDANEVELWINGERVYLGPPTSTWTSLHEREEWRDRLWDLRVVARNTTTGASATTTYVTDAEEVGALRSATYSAGSSASLTGQGSAAIRVRRTAATQAASSVSAARAVAASASARIQDGHYVVAQVRAAVRARLAMMAEAAAAVEEHRAIVASAGVAIAIAAGANPVLRRWNGSEFMPVTIRRWTGSQYQAVPLKRR